MKILVERLRDRPIELVLEGSAAWREELFALIPELEGAVVEPFRFRLRAQRMGAEIGIEGVMVGVLELTCSRCLARYRHALREPFRLVLEPAGLRVPAEPEAAQDLERYGVCLSDELELGWFRGPEIDLGPFLREVVTLGLPVKPLCREDCLGLCPRCGADRNVEPCACGQRSGPSPFDVLAKLREGTSEGES